MDAAPVHRPATKAPSAWWMAKPCCCGTITVTAWAIACRPVLRAQFPLCRSEVELVDDQQPEEDDTTKPGDGTTTQPDDDVNKPGQSTDDSGNNTGNTTDTTAKPDGDKNPQTGDTNQMMAYVVVLVAAMGALRGVVTLRKRVWR